MKWTPAFALVIALLLAACQAAPAVTPTPFTGPGATIPLPPAQPQPVAVRDLVLTPSRYENSYLQVSGGYRPLPRLACAGAPRRSPATWSLEDGNLYVQVAGYDSLLRAAARPGLPISAAGQWRRWRGQVGCGKDAPLVEIWFLEVTSILSPNPLAAATPAAIAGLGSGPAAPPQSETPAGLPFQTATPAFDTPPPEDGLEPSPIPTLPPTATTTPALPTATTAAALPSATPSPTPPADAPTPTPTAAATATLAPGVTASATTPPGGDPPPTIIPPTNEVDQGELEFDQLSKGELPPYTAHGWTFSGASGRRVTFSAIAPPERNAVLSLRGPAGNLLVANQNNAPADQAETIADFALPADGQYTVLVGEAAGLGGLYALAAYDDSSFPLILPGNLRYGSNLDATMPAESDHFWHFTAAAGDVVTVRVDPTDQSDLFIVVLGPAMEQVSEFADDGGEGEPEEISALQITAAGYYTVWVAENFYLPSSYNITLTRQ